MSTGVYTYVYVCAEVYTCTRLCTYTRNVNTRAHTDMAHTPVYMTHLYTSVNTHVYSGTHITCQFAQRKTLTPGASVERRTTGHGCTFVSGLVEGVTPRVLRQGLSCPYRERGTVHAEGH